MAKPRNVTREILLSLGAAVLFAGGLTAYLLQTIPSREELSAGMSPAAPPGPKKPGDLEVAGPIVERFVAQLAAQQHEAAYALMAQPYRDAVTLEGFRATCAGSPFLAGAQRGVLLSTRRMVAAGATGPFTLQGRGSIVSAAGSIDAGFTLLVTGGDARILVLTLADVPVLNGISPSAPR